MTLPFDTTKPETRSDRIVFYTDPATAKWIYEQGENTELGVSLFCHRMAKQARTSTERPSPRRRASDAA